MGRRGKRAGGTLDLPLQEPKEKSRDCSLTRLRKRGRRKHGLIREEGGKKIPGPENGLIFFFSGKGGKKEKRPVAWKSPVL